MPSSETREQLSGITFRENLPSLCTKNVKTCCRPQTGAMLHLSAGQSGRDARLENSSVNVTDGLPSQHSRRAECCGPTGPFNLEGVSKSALAMLLGRFPANVPTHWKSLSMCTYLAHCLYTSLTTVSQNALHCTAAAELVSEM